MRIEDSVDLTRSDESRVVIAGDWHGNIRWVQTLLPRIHRIAPDIKTIIQLGDFGYWRTGNRPGKGYLGAVDYWARRSGIERILVVPGNHEQWPLLTNAFDANPGQAVQVTDAVWMMPIGYRFTLGTHTYLAFGGAASYDADQRTEGVDWFPEEMANEQQAVAAAAGRKVDVLLAHETITNPTPLVQAELLSNAADVPDAIHTRSALSRRNVSAVYDHHRPARFFHGHMHVPDQMTLPDGRQIWSMGTDRQMENTGVLDLKTLDFEWLGS